ncbi:hypothetical protein ABZ478_05810 [Streptomyces sp. NPDC005706]|uniref:hypothetical protein n=1 Tax=Streptomyces sp. NPDC005706 TaxID=3157169 RepID=UPI0033E46710
MLFWAAHNRTAPPEILAELIKDSARLGAEARRGPPTLAALGDHAFGRRPVAGHRAGGPRPPGALAELTKPTASELFRAVGFVGFAGQPER